MSESTLLLCIKHIMLYLLIGSRLELSPSIARALGLPLLKRYLLGVCLIARRDSTEALRQALVCFSEVNRQQALEGLKVQE